MNKHYLLCIALLISGAVSAQVQSDRAVQLTGAGTDAKIEGIKSVSASSDAAHKEYVDTAFAARIGVTVGGGLNPSGTGAAGNPYLFSLANMAALSVKGNATNASAAPTDIAAASDNQVLRRSGTALGFGSVNLASSSAVTGTLPVGNGGTGQTSYANGQLLIGNGTGNTLSKATLTGTTNQVIVTNGAGAITLSTPQDIHTSASPTFSSVNVFNSSSFVISASTVEAKLNFIPNNDFKFFTNNTERMRISGAGQVGIGVTSTSHILHISAQGRSTAASWATSSDVRLKENIVDYKKGVNELMQIHVVEYNFKNNVENMNDEEKARRRVGIIAQEIEKVLPGTVTRIKENGLDDQRVFSADELIFLLINASKELNQKIESVTALNTILTKTTETLQAEKSNTNLELSKIKAEIDFLKNTLQKSER